MENILSDNLSLDENTATDLILVLILTNWISENSLKLK